jgi:NADPH:quinone reductase-like Zn-dependent oxidoreductase
MQAAIVRAGGELSFEQVADAHPGLGAVVVELRTAAVNSRDIFVRRGSTRFPCPDPRLRRRRHSPRHGR